MGARRGRKRGAEPLASTPEEFGRFLSTEMVNWREIITKGNITLK